ncbi:hypothetical protein SDRG_01482 [Saprolegnia diclina VS20]|uniref:Nucleotide-diphospho-sugar transferase n=1 Tax=Saprolegnia diclina (strain VS20) TaxID=1156394 RepID=T0SF54_SAPDV|nr:hypothetical protein SDRG_01482 [Saprolegnia diclina VS20]EQC41517.1 hypothetical protein SDRG_01482 [Saprolegnia diclina VS20]|eukprot:XP_008605231.1 hypothetical protein SDRG_01482 [Saprolegnia diclina VS20]
MAPSQWPLDNGSISSPALRCGSKNVASCLRRVQRSAVLFAVRVSKRPRLLRLLGLLVALGLGVAFWYHKYFNIKPVFRSDMDSTMTTIPHFNADQIHTRWTDESFECIGWHETDTCEPENTYPRRELAKMRSCSEMVERRKAGYCEVRNRTSGAILRLMVTSCRSIVNRDFTCDMARDFSEFSLLAKHYQHSPMATSLTLPTAQQHPPTNAILMIVYDKVLPSAYAAIRVLRDHGCEIPIEMWYRPDEMSADVPLIHELTRDYNVHMREIFDKRAVGFHTKPHAVYYSAYDNILLLDADNIPVRDPSYLFEDPTFLRDGAVFWPDYWQPANSLFDVHSHSLVWQLLGMDFWDQFEQESGQVLINRRKAKDALNKLMYYSTHEPHLIDKLSLVWGDKDLFRLAWRNTSTPYHMIERPPAIGGIYSYAKRVFCGLAMVQYDPTGNIVFFHRNSVKLDGSANQPHTITHIQQYRSSRPASEYRVGQIIAELDQESCYHIRSNKTMDGELPTFITPIEYTPYAAIEPAAIKYSIVGRKLHEAGMAHLHFGESLVYLCVIGAVILVYWQYMKRAQGKHLPARWKSY